MANSFKANQTNLYDLVCYDQMFMAKCAKKSDKDMYLK